ncbi:MAG: hypothetical protein AAF270_08335 [Pseudomonadota bacterium]
MRVLIIVIVALITGCGPKGVSAPQNAVISLDELATHYVVLELAMGVHDASHVDAYSGPEALRTQAEATGWSLEDIDAQAQLLQTQVSATSDSRRAVGLQERLTALRARVAINQQQYMTFDEESLALFGAVAPDYDDAHFAAILAGIDAALPGEAPLPERVDAFTSRFEIPADKLDVVFAAAMAECRKRALAWIDLPADESFTIEYVNDKPWSGYNWYQGGAISLIQINTDFPTQISRAVDLGCHEGYPGHHTYNALLERDLAQARGWVEYSLYPLFSPQSLIAEGSANYGIDLAFPGDERIAFERDVLFPLAGLDADEADGYYALTALLAELSYAGNEAARDYLNGDKSRDETVEWLVTFALNTPERAAQRVRFFDTYRSYVINYNLGKDLVADYIERDGADTAQRWQRFERILSEPVSAMDIR